MGKITVIRIIEQSMFPTLISQLDKRYVKIAQNLLQKRVDWITLIVADDRRYDSYCDYRKVNRDEEEEEDTFSCLKSPETSGGCWYGSVPIWHLAANLVSNPFWVCKSTKVRFFFSINSTKSYLECCFK